MSETYTIGDEVSCLRRELLRRRARYPGLVQAGKLSAERAQKEIELMTRCLSRLERLQAEGQQLHMYDLEGDMLRQRREARRARQRRDWPYRD